MSIITSLSSSVATALGTGGYSLADLIQTGKAAIASNVTATEGAATKPTVTPLSGGDFTTLYTYLSNGGGGTDISLPFLAFMTAAKAGAGSQQAMNAAMWWLVKVIAAQNPGLLAQAGGW